MIPTHLPLAEVSTTLGKLPSPSVILTPKATVSLLTVANAIPDFLQQKKKKMKVFGENFRK